MKRHVFDTDEIGYDLVKNRKDYFCKNCQKLIASQKSPTHKIIYNAEWKKRCKRNE